MTNENEHSVRYEELLGAMYGRWVLDCLVEIAYAVSKDFIARAEFYKGSDIPAGIVDLRMAYGNTSTLPDRSQRQDINSPIFGSSDGYPADTTNDRFRGLRKPLFDACITLSELTISTAAASLKPRVLSALELLQQRLKSFDSVSIRRSYIQVVHVSDLAFNILTSGGISQVFGVTPPPPKAWPLESNDSNGSLLIRAISEKLPLAPELIFNEDKFQRLRRVAQQGRDALRVILNTDATNPPDFDELVTTVYNWAISLREYGGQL